MFRRSGSFVCFFFEGSGPDPLGESFLEALANHRFRTIENAASEETSTGWVTRNDPSGGSFEREDMDCDAAVWMRMRIDKKSAPTKWLQIHRQAEERSAGRKLSAKERKELKEDLLSKLLPRVLPTIALVDALFFPKQRMIMLFGTSKAVKEAFLSLFYRTFSVSLRAADPYQLAMSLDLDSTRKHALETVTPVQWPSDRKTRPAAVVASDDLAEPDEELAVQSATIGSNEEISE